MEERPKCFDSDDDTDSGLRGAFTASNHRRERRRFLRFDGGRFMNSFLLWIVQNPL
jgi:hypothetical protein